MKSEQKDFFKEKAKDYDTESARTKNIDHIAETILKEIPFSKEMRIMDFGSGTGLLLTNIAPFVDKITAIDISSSMNEVLRSKINSIKCNLEIVEIDLTKDTFDRKFDAIISSMAIHHIEDISNLFKKFYTLLNDNGFIALADLDKEDGSFHSTNTGVFHDGFDREKFLTIAKNAGFKDLKIQDASTIEKPTGTYSVFLLTGKK